MRCSRRLESRGDLRFWILDFGLKKRDISEPHNFLYLQMDARVEIGRNERMASVMIIEAGDVRVEAELNETTTGLAIWNALPINARARTWGDEIYFQIPVKADLENGSELVSAGDLGYWPQGSAFCIFFGPTPISRGNEIRPASAVNIVGKVRGDARIFACVPDGAPIRFSRVQ